MQRGIALQTKPACRHWQRAHSHHVLQQDGLREDGPVVDATTTVTVPAGAHLEVEWAVDLVLLGAEDLGEVLSHAASV
jgi:hypothetical protein